MIDSKQSYFFMLLSTTLAARLRKVTIFFSISSLLFSNISPALASDDAPASIAPAADESTQLPTSNESTSGDVLSSGSENSDVQSSIDRVDNFSTETEESNETIENKSVANT